jgi:hypothetical protein
MRLRILLVCCAALALTVGVATASGGNYYSKLCQKGGWQFLTKADASPFGSEAACVFYAKNGATVLKGASWQACESYGGLFSTDPRSSVFNPEYKGKKMFWTCNNYTDAGGAASDALVSLCLFTDHGQGFDRFTSEDPNYSTCWKDPYLS